MTKELLLRLNKYAAVTFLTVVSTITVSMGINLYIDHRDPAPLISLYETTPMETAVHESVFKAVDAPIEDNGIEYTFYTELENATLAVDTVLALPDGLVEVPIILMDGKEIALDDDLTCLTMNIYFEGRNRSVKMRKGSSWTVVNRIGRYHNKDICDVVTNSRKDATSGLLVEDECHYSWYCDAREILKVGENPIEKQAYKDSVKIARTIIRQASVDKEKYDFTNGATHYHSMNVSPYWISSMTYLTAYADHLFYQGY